ncbi:Gfo/Idh/MocA family oxidoreductase [Candidatus Dependentiae bacterium]|nr:Gfo/Idh/MocA family oxidoreductase [Candidatus Dependentiae bacterium]
MIKLGIIGLGKMGGYHASISQTLPNVKLVAVADPHQSNLDKVTDQTVIKTNDFTLWLDQVDAVIIAIQTAKHYAAAKTCLEHGKHILVEKPITSTSEQAAELFALAHKNNLALHVGHVERFNGAIQELKKIVTRPLFIECHRMGPFVQRAARDSVVLDLMIHDVDLVLSLVNEKPVSVTAHGSSVHSPLADVASVQLTFPSGCIASVVASRASQIKQRSMTVHEKEAFYHLDFTTQDLVIHRQTSSSVQVGLDQLRYRQESLIEHVFVHKDNPLKLEIMHFIRAIETQQDMRNALQDIQALDIIVEIERQLSVQMGNALNSTTTPTEHRSTSMTI